MWDFGICLIYKMDKRSKIVNLLCYLFQSSIRKASIFWNKPGTRSWTKNKSLDSGASLCRPALIRAIPVSGPPYPTGLNGNGSLYLVYKPS